MHHQNMGECEEHDWAVPSIKQRPLLQDPDDVRHLASSFEYRRMESKVHIAVDFVLRRICSVRMAETVFEVPHSVIGRAIAAKREGRDICVSGRPPALRQELAVRLTEWVDKSVSDGKQQSIFDSSQRKTDI